MWLTLSHNAAGSGTGSAIEPLQVSAVTEARTLSQMKPDASDLPTSPRALRGRPAWHARALVGVLGRWSVAEHHHCPLLQVVEVERNLPSTFAAPTDASPQASRTTQGGAVCRKDPMCTTRLVALFNVGTLTISLETRN